MQPSIGTKRARRRNLGREALLAVAACFVMLVLLEIGVRIFDPQPANRYRWSPDCGYEPVPGAAFVYRRREFAIPVRYNDAGMRDRDRRESKPPNTLRIALLGDSQVESKEVPFDSTFGARLERRLRPAGVESPVEVLNFGVSGFGTVATLARFHVLGRRFAPDLAVYVFMDNDLGDNLNRDRALFDVHGDALELRRLPAGWRTRASRRMLDVVRHRSQLYAFLKFRILELKNRRAAMPAAAPATATSPTTVAAQGPEWDVLRLALRAFQVEAQAAGASFLVVQAGASATRAAELTALCARESIACFDLRPALAAGGRGLWFEIDGHWRASGHAVAAQALAPVLERALSEATAAQRPAVGNAPLNARATK